MGRWTFVATQSARLTTLLFFVAILLGATVYRPNETQLAFLSNSEKDRQPAVEAPMVPPATDANPFDGRWIFTRRRVPRGGLGIGGHQGRQGDRPQRRRKRNSGWNHP